MTGAIISPWVFYLIGTLDAFGTALVCAWISLFALGLVLLEVASLNNEKRRRRKRWGKRLLVASAIILPIAIAIPNKDTSTKMLVASQITYENVDRAKDTVDYIADKLLQQQKR